MQVKEQRRKVNELENKTIKDTFHDITDPLKEFADNYNDKYYHKSLKNLTSADVDLSKTD